MLQPGITTKVLSDSVQSTLLFVTKLNERLANCQDGGRAILSNVDVAGEQAIALYEIADLA